MRTIAIGFHDVVQEAHLARPIAPGHTTLYTIGRSEFRKHLEAIRSCVSWQAVRRVDRLDANAAGTCVALTCDDGALSAYTCVAEELDSLGWPGHFFMTTDWIGRPGFVDRHQVRELHERGHVIGSHSRSHPERMSHLKWDRLVQEWSDSSKALSDMMGQPVKVASVPGGYYSRKVGLAAAACGIEVLFTSEPTASSSLMDGCLILGRYCVRRCTSPSVVGAIAAGATRPRFQQAALWFAKGVARRVMGRSYLTMRRVLLERVRQP